MSKHLRRTLGAAARDARQALGSTQQQLSERLGVNVEFYGRIERGQAWPSVRVFARMVSVLGISGDTLLAIDLTHAPKPAPLTRTDDSPEIRELIALVRKAGPDVVRLVDKLVRGIERVLAEKRQGS
jgi:transcriptional regulator with XRE-family HTH domain